jgi:hypothetical protein
MTQTLEQLREQATSLGIKVHHRHTEDTLREMIELKLNPPEIEQATVASAKIDSPEIVQLPTFEYVEHLEELTPVRVRMRNNHHHELDVLYEDVSKYEADGWYMV